jgi:hypothetical protein
LCTNNVANHQFWAFLSAWRYRPRPSRLNPICSWASADVVDQPEFSVEVNRLDDDERVLGQRR